ncbi:unnamed protein product, partial [Effrenium voratum]
DWPTIAQDLLREGDQGELGVAYRNASRCCWRPRLVQLPRMVSLGMEGCYLITGGLGALAAEIADFFADCGVEELILSSRTGIRDRSFPSRSSQVLEGLKGKGVKVHIVRGDISQQEHVANIFRTFGYITGIVHAAGILRDQSIPAVRWSDFSEVFRAKASGAYWLHKASLQLQLKDFVFCSSISSLLGSVGQACYASANSFQDGLATLRHQQGLAAKCVNFGPWADVGMAAELTLQPTLRHLPVQSALDVLGQVLQQQRFHQLMVAVMDYRLLGQRFQPWLQHLVSDSTDQVGPDGRSALERPSLEALQSVLAEFCEGDADPTTSFLDLGLDSLGLEHFAARIREQTGLEIQATPTWRSSRIFVCAWKLQVCKLRKPQM